jgi:DnaJ-class molecular chaperone
LLKEAFETLSNDNQRQRYERYGKDNFKSIKDLTCIDKRNPENPRDERKAPSFKLTIPVSIADIYNGTVVKGKFPKQTACPVCQGTGAKSPKDLKPCNHCSGKGFALRDEQNFYGQKFQAETICPVCKGSGKTIAKVCDSCRGSRLISKMETIEIPIPKGLPNGNKFTLRNMGDEPLHGAPSDF